jgi:hypothetical protein
MTAISPEERALIDRLHAVDIARPRQDSDTQKNLSVFKFSNHAEHFFKALRKAGLPVN